MPLDTGTKLLDITDMAFEDVAHAMQEDIVGMPDSKRALPVTRVCILRQGGYPYVYGPGDVIVDAPQQMRRMGMGAGLFEFLIGAKL